ncbi:MAG: hypothetical protein WCK98_05765 [bacterium]
MSFIPSSVFCGRINPAPTSLLTSKILSTNSSILPAIFCFSGVSSSGIELTNQLFGQQK